MGVAVFALAAVMELTAEPLWVMGQIHQYVSLKVRHVYSIIYTVDIIINYKSIQMRIYTVDY